MKVPWWALSPSPISILFYAIMIIYATRKLKKHCNPTPNPVKLVTDSFFLLGIIVLATDLQWVIICAIRFGPAYPRSVLRLVYCLFRDAAGILLCYSLTHEHFQHTIKIGPSTVKWLAVNLAFLITWFGLSPSPAYTDWTYAIKYDHPLTTILTSLTISHLIGRIIVAKAFTNMFPQEEGNI